MLIAPAQRHILQRRMPSFSYVTTIENLGNLATYTFPSANIGAQANDATIVCVFTANQVAGGTHNSAQIGGLDMFKCAESVPDFGADEPSVSIWSFPYPFGGTPNIVLNLPDAAGHCDVSIYRLIGLTSHIPHCAMAGALDGSTSRVEIGLASRRGAVVIAGIDVYPENVTFTWDGGVVSQNAAIPYAGEAGAAAVASGYSKGSGAIVGITPSASASMAYAAASFF